MLKYEMNFWLALLKMPAGIFNINQKGGK